MEVSWRRGGWLGALAGLLSFRSTTALVDFELRRTSTSR